MSLDDRLEFLAKNIQSLHEAVFENTRQIAEMRSGIAEMRSAMGEQNRRTDERFERVFGMIEKLVEVAQIQERRITRLEENGQPE